MKPNKWTRRSLMTGIGAAVGAFGLRATRAHAQSSGGHFQPSRHEQDSWLDEMPGQHRVFIDSSTPEGGGSAVLYANNLYRANEGAYSIAAEDLAIVVCFRHASTPFGYNDAMWKKYGEALSNLMSFVDPKTETHPSSNLLDADDYGTSVSNMGNTITAQIERGTQFAVCDAATRAFSGGIARATGGSQEDVYQELIANAIPNSRFVSAGVVAMTRSQEYGFSLLYAG